MGRLSVSRTTGGKKEVEQLGLVALAPKCGRVAGYVLRVKPKGFGRFNDLPLNQLPSESDLELRSYSERLLEKL